MTLQHPERRPQTAHKVYTIIYIIPYTIYHYTTHWERLYLTFDPNSPPVLRGIPVLFIPGNAGSHKQGMQDRHAASIAVFFYLPFSSICSPSFNFLSLAPSMPPLLTHTHTNTSLVRSSASIALLMHPAEFPQRKHFDFFAVNLNEVE